MSHEGDVMLLIGKVEKSFALVTGQKGKFLTKYVVVLLSFLDIEETSLTY